MKTRGWSDAMGRAAMNYWCRLRLRSPWVQGGGRYIVCLDESGGKKSLDTLSHAIPLSHTHSGRTLAQITGLSWCCRLLRPLKTCYGEITQARKNMLARFERFPPVCAIHQSAEVLRKHGRIPVIAISWINICPRPH